MEKVALKPSACEVRERSGSYTAAWGKNRKAADKFCADYALAES